MTKIKSITLHFPNSDDGEVVYYQVGSPCLSNRTGDIVTEIKVTERCGEITMRPYYEIYTKDGIIAEMHQYGIIEYFPKETNDQK